MKTEKFGVYAVHQIRELVENFMHIVCELQLDPLQFTLISLVLRARIGYGVCAELKCDL